MFQVIEGLRPTRPAGDVIPDHIWNIMEQCWAHNFADRPTILGIVLELAMHDRLAGDLSFPVCPLSNGYFFLAAKMLSYAVDQDVTFTAGMADEAKS
jgi:hypothetical protein